MKIAGRGVVWSAACITVFVGARVAAVGSASSAIGAAEEASLPWSIVVAPVGEPGQPIVVSGVICAPDGTTPAAGVVMSLYHTDAEGLYTRRGEPNSQPRLNGRLRTNAEGRYQFRTIKPGSYPDSRIPAHIHAKVSAPGLSEVWIDEFWFEGDPHITSHAASQQRALGRFSAIMTCAAATGAGEPLTCTRDIRLPHAPSP